jgi:hypothetical protein
MLAFIVGALFACAPGKAIIEVVVNSCRRAEKNHIGLSRSSLEPIFVQIGHIMMVRLALNRQGAWHDIQDNNEKSSFLFLFIYLFLIS